MVNKNVLTARIEQIDRHIDKLSPYQKLSYAEFRQDTVAQDVIEYNLFQITNHIIDIIQHIVVDEDYGLPGTPYEAAQILSQKGILKDNDLRLLKKMIGFRNVVGHDYIAINKKVVYTVFTEGINDIKDILAKISAKFL